MHALKITSWIPIRSTRKNGGGRHQELMKIGLKDALALPGVNMKPSTTDQIKGKFHEAKGAAKEKVGQATNNPNMVAEGQDEKVAGKVQKKVGQIAKVLEK
jgi:uncharacterized protein YjbJ (UPF0337 family)